MSSPFIADWLFEHAARTPSAPAVATPDHALSYEELADRVRRFARALQDRGIGPGARVMIALPNCCAAVVCSLGLQALGACAVVVARNGGREVLRDALAQSGATQAIFSAQDARGWFDLAREAGLQQAWVVGNVSTEVAGEVPTAVLHGDGSLAAPSPAADLPALRDEHAPAQVLFTSGSTGRPRGVIHTFRNIDANSRAIAASLRLSASDRALSILPLSYCYGRSVLQTHLLVGGSVFFDDRFMYPRVVLDALASERCTGFPGVPLTFEVLRRQLGGARVSVPTLRYLTQAGGPMAPETIDWLREAFAPAELHVMYGQTEATARLTCLPPSFAHRKRGSIGLPVRGVELAVLDENGTPLPSGITGELCARGPSISPGYLGAPEETAFALRGGWLHTGDLGYRDAEGFYFLVGRLKELMKVGGHRVSPIEIEAVLARHPSVAEVAVAGAPDPIEGERPVAYVVARGRPPEPRELRQFCSAHLPTFKVPREFHLVPALPRNEAGKLLRHQLHPTSQGVTP